MQPLLPVGLRYSAALIGPGSEVLGYDTPMSTDHSWGPRLQIFLSEHEFAENGAALVKRLAESLPDRFMGYPTFFPAQDGEPARHQVEITSIRRFVKKHLGFDIEKELGPLDWLAASEQALLSITRGEVFHDGLDLASVRRRSAYYPHDVWLYQMACVWNRIGQEEHLAGRAGYVGDELGAAIIASRLVRDMMRLCFLMERRYAPYPKWFGTAFMELDAAAELAPLLSIVLQALGWEARDAALRETFEFVARKQNALSVCPPRTEGCSTFHSRPFGAIHLGADFAGALIAEIRDPEVGALAERTRIGGLDVFSDSTDLLSDVRLRLKLRGLFQ